MSEQKERSGSQIVTAPKRLEDFTPLEFQDYVKSLHAIRMKRSAKQKSTGLSARVRPNGKIIVSCKRDWKWMTEQEMEQMAMLHGYPLNELFIYLKDRGFTILRDGDEATEKKQPGGAHGGVKSDRRKKSKL